MQIAPDEPCDDLEVVFDFGRHGWSVLYLIIRGEIRRYAVTHIFSDPLHVLIDLCSLMIDRTDGLIRLYDEPGEAIVTVAFDHDQPHLVELSVLTSDDMNTAPEKARHEFTMTAPTIVLIEQVMSQLYKIRALLSDKAYARDRDAFPHQAFRMLLEKKKNAEKQGRGSRT